jgi:hypothetical protein
VLALGSAVGGPVFAAGIALVQVIFVVGAIRRAAVPGTASAWWIALLVGLTATTWLAVEGLPGLTPIARVLAVGFLVALFAQLWRRDGRPLLATSLSFAVAAFMLASLPAAFVALRNADSGAYSVGLGLLGIGLVFLADAVAGSSVVGRTIAILVAGAIAAGLVLTLDLSSDVPAVGAVAVACFGALMAVVGLAACDRVVEEPSLGSSPAPVSATGVVLEQVGSEIRSPLRLSLPFVAAAPVIYLLGRIVIG